MTRAGRALALVVSFLIVLSPLAAALAGSGLDRAALLAALAPAERGPFLDSLIIAAVAAATALALGVPHAILVGGANAPLRKALVFLALLVLVMPPYLAAAAWIDFLGPAGRLASIVAPASASAEDARRLMLRDFVYSAPSAGIVLGASYFPLVALALAAAERRLDGRVLEAARLARGKLGALRARGSLAGPAALGGALLVFAVALVDFATPQILRVRTLDEEVHDKLQELGEVSTAAGLALPLVLVVLVAGALGAFLAAPRRVASGAALEGEAPRFELRRLTLLGKIAALLVGTVAILPGLVFPAASLVLQARTAPLDRAGAGASFERFGLALSRAWAVMGGEAVRSVVLGAVAATTAVLLAVIVGRLLARPTRRDAALACALAVGLAVPAPLVGLGLIRLWNGAGPLVAARRWVMDGSAVLLLGWLARFLPVAVLLARAGFARVPPELEEAAALSGKKRGERTVRVVLPLAAPGLVAAWLAVYVLSVAEFGTSVLVSPPGLGVISVSVVNQVHYGQGPAVAAGALLLLGAVSLPLLPASVAFAFFSRKGGEAR